MKSENETSVDVLTGLIEICKDGQQGFQTAAEDAEEGSLAQLFQGYSQQRAGFIQELQNRVRALGADTQKRGSVSGSIHRGWINLKSAIASNEPHAVLSECERGEDAALRAYNEAMEELVDGGTRELILRQRAEIQAVHDHVKQLRDSPAYAKR